MTKMGRIRRCIFSCFLVALLIQLASIYNAYAALQFDTGGGGGASGCSGGTAFSANFPSTQSICHYQNSNIFSVPVWVEYKFSNNFIKAARNGDRTVFSAADLQNIYNGFFLSPGNNRDGGVKKLGGVESCVTSGGSGFFRLANLEAKYNFFYDTQEGNGHAQEAKYSDTASLNDMVIFTVVAPKDVNYYNNVESKKTNPKTADDYYGSILRYAPIGTNTLYGFDGGAAGLNSWRVVNYNDYVSSFTSSNFTNNDNWGQYVYYGGIDGTHLIASAEGRGAFTSPTVSSGEPYAYKKYKQHGGSWDLNTFNGRPGGTVDLSSGVRSFCAYPEKTENTYSGSTKVFYKKGAADEQSSANTSHAVVNIAPEDDTVTVVKQYTIGREGSGTINAKIKRDLDNDWISFAPGSKDETETKSIEPGGTVEFCAEMKYYKKAVKETGDPNYTEEGEANKSCLTFYRPYYVTDIDGAIESKVYETSSQSSAYVASPNPVEHVDYKSPSLSKEVIVDEPYAKVNFTPYICRHNSKYAAQEIPSGATYSNNFKLTYYEDGAWTVSGATPRAVNISIGKVSSIDGTCERSGGPSWHTFASDITSSHETGELQPGEAKTYKESITYPERVDNAGNSKAGNKSVDLEITVRRRGFKCVGFEGGYSFFGPSKGANMAKITIADSTNTNLNDNNPNRRQASTDNYPGGGTTDNAVLFTKPNRRIRFEYNACAGGAYAVAKSSEGDGWGDTQFIISNPSDPNGNGLFGFRPESQQDLDEGNKIVLEYGNTGNLNRNGYQKRITSNHGATPAVSALNTAIASFLTDKYRENEYPINSGSMVLPKYTLAEKLWSPGGKSDGLPIESDNVGQSIKRQIEWKNLEMNYGSKTTGENSVATAELRVPYNYYLNPTVDINFGNDYYVRPGQVIDKLDIDLGVMDRKNEQVGETYATKIKPTTIQVSWFKMTGSVDSGSVSSSGKLKRGEIAARSICNEVSSRASECTEVEILNDEVRDKTNDKINLSTETNRKSIPFNNVKLGDTVCYVASVYPYDSHAVIRADGKPYFNAENATQPDAASAIDDTDQSHALQKEADSNDYTYISAPICRNIAKQPTVSIEGGDLLVGKAIKTSNFRFYPNPNDLTNGSTIGSWSEYGALVGGKEATFVRRTTNFATGATTAYGKDTTVSTINQRSVDAGYVKSLNSGTDTDGTLCLYNTQTITNNECASGKTGIDPSTESETVYDKVAKNVARLVTALKTKYRNAYSKVATNGTNNYTFKGCAIAEGETEYSVVAGGTNYSCRPNDGVAYLHFGSSADSEAIKTIDSLSITWPDNNSNRTLIIDANNNNLIIKSNIVSYYETYSKLSKVPNVIIFAKNVFIDPSVERIDAWIISSNDSSEGDGLINTCYGTSDANQDSDDCKYQLVFNGPVIARNLELRRSYGAGTGEDESFDSDRFIQRAEIFNMNPLPYYWGYNQTVIESTLKTTFSKEIPSRL